MLKRGVRWLLPYHLHQYLTLPQLGSRAHLPQEAFLTVPMLKDLSKLLPYLFDTYFLGPPPINLESQSNCKSLQR